MSRLLVSSLLWAPDHSSMRQQAEEVLWHLDILSEQKDKQNFDWLIVDVGVEEKRAKRRIEDLARIGMGSHLPLCPARNWGGGKNAGLDVFSGHINCPEAHLALDQDTILRGEDWAERIADFHVAHPDVLACTLSGPAHGASLHPLPDGSEVWATPNFLGCAMTFGRKFLSTIGGFNVRDLHPYGYQDAEVGLRIARDPAHLKACGNVPYINPLRLEMELCQINYRATNTAYAQKKSQSAGAVAGAFARLRQEYANGKSIYLPYDDLGPSSENCFFRGGF